MMNHEEATALSRRLIEETPPGRRRFLIMLIVGISGFCGLIVGVPVVGPLIGPLLLGAPKDVWRRVGKVSDFKIGHTVEVVYPPASTLPWGGVTDKTGAYLRRNSADSFTAFSMACQHLGCDVRWIPSANLFMCPCHGGVYYADGTVAAGPPPRSLQRYPVRVRNGVVEVKTAPLPMPGFE